MAMLHYQRAKQTIGIIDLSWTLGMAHSRYNLWSCLILWCFTKIYEPSNCGLPRKCKAGILTDKTRTSFRTCRTCWMIGKWRVAVYLQSPIKLRLALVSATRVTYIWLSPTHTGRQGRWSGWWSEPRSTARRLGCTPKFCMAFSTKTSISGTWSLDTGAGRRQKCVAMRHD